MKSWRMRVARALAVAAASTSVVAGVAGPARADGFTALPINKVGQLAVDGVHQRVLISDPTTSKIVQTDYAGAVTATKDGYPGVDDLLLSADGQRLFAAWPDGHAIVALDPADLSEIARYPVGDGISPHHLAAAGDRVWFGYRATADTGGIGSLDLRGAAPVVTLDDGAQHWQDAPRLAATAGRPGLLAAAGLAPAEGERKANFAVFDVSGDTPARTARLDFWAVPAEIALTPDGATLLYPWNDTLVSRGTTDLATNTGPLVMTHTAHAVDVAADGTVAGGSWSPYDPDVHLFTSAGTLIRRYELPDTGKASYTSDTLDYGALAWEPGGDQLFGVAFNDVGEYSLSRLSTPRKSVPEFTLTGPTSARRAAALTLTGKLTASLAPPTGTPDQLTHPGTVQLPP